MQTRRSTGRWTASTPGNFSVPHALAKPRSVTFVLSAAPSTQEAVAALPFFPCLNSRPKPKSQLPILRSRSFLRRLSPSDPRRVPKSYNILGQPTSTANYLPRASSADSKRPFTPRDKEPLSTLHSGLLFLSPPHPHRSQWLHIPPSPAHMDREPASRLPDPWHRTCCG